MQLYMFLDSWTPAHNKWVLFQVKIHIWEWFNYVSSFYMYVYICKFNKGINIQMCKMQVNMHTKQKFSKASAVFPAILAGNWHCGDIKKHNNARKII